MVSTILYNICIVASIFSNVSSTALLSSEILASVDLKPRSDAEWTEAINQKLCEEGTHNDQVAAAFFACYDEAITPGGDVFVQCQLRVFGVLINTEENVDNVCAQGDKIEQYGGCIVLGLIGIGVNPAVSIHFLNVCQGEVLGVPEPTNVV